MEPIYPNEQPNHTQASAEVMDFDERFSTRHLRILKALTPLLPRHIQPAIAVSIRMQELKIALLSYTDAAFHKNRDSQRFNEGVPSSDFFHQIFSRMEPLLSPAEQSSFQRIRQTMQMFETMKQLEPLMQFFAQMQEENASSSNSEQDTDAGSSASGNTDLSDLFTSLSGFGNLADLSGLISELKAADMDETLNTAQAALPNKVQTVFPQETDRKEES